MKEICYTIKPLTWRRKFNDDCQRYEAENGICDFAVTRWRDEETGKWSIWKWSYTISEYHNEGSSECRTAAEGKASAWHWWTEYLASSVLDVFSDVKDLA